MLDQSTDRSWWMIAAVVIGALIAGLMTKGNPEVFGMVTGFTKDKMPTVEVDYGTLCTNLLGHCNDSDFVSAEDKGGGNYSVVFIKEDGTKTTVTITKVSATSYRASSYTVAPSGSWRSYNVLLGGVYEPPTLEKSFGNLD